MCVFGGEGGNVTDPTHTYTSVSLASTDLSCSELFVLVGSKDEMTSTVFRKLKTKNFSLQAFMEMENRQMPNGVFTTAELRPNAYIPDAEATLPLPKPYGALAPFKPNEPGSNMRHIRKPIIKPIEI